MKRTLMTIAVMFLVGTTGCLETCYDGPNVVISAMTASDTDSPQNESVIRVGLEQELVEVGVQTHLIGIHGEDQFWSAYVTASLEEMGIAGQPYFGYQAGIPTEDEDGGFHGPILGTRHALSERVESVVEGWYRSFNGSLKNADYVDEWKALAGIRIRF